MWCDSGFLAILRHKTLQYKSSLFLEPLVINRGGERCTHRWGLGRQPIYSGVAVMERESFRSPLARAIGLGSAKKGAQHWLAERLTAIALVPLSLWIVASIIARAGTDYAAFIGWLEAGFPRRPTRRITLLRHCACAVGDRTPLSQSAQLKRRESPRSRRS